MRTIETRHPFTCVTCEIEISGAPTFHVGVPFCCAGCVAGGPCVCSYDPPEPADVRHCLDVADPLVGASVASLIGDPVGATGGGAGADRPTARRADRTRPAPVAPVWTLVGAH